MTKTNNQKRLEGAHYSRLRFTQTSVGVPRMPRNLSRVAKRVWARIVPPLVAMGHVGAIDALGLAQMCELTADYQDALDAYRSENDSVKKGRIYKILSSALAQLTKMQKAYGLTPEGRKTIDVLPQPDAEEIKFFGE